MSRKSSGPGIDEYDGSDPPLPDEEPPELPARSPYTGLSPGHRPACISPQSANDDQDLEKTACATTQDEDAWEAIYDSQTSRFYFYNKDTKITTWENPRAHVQPTAANSLSEAKPEDYAKHFSGSLSDAALAFEARFDRRTGRFVTDPGRGAKNYSEHARSERQMSRYFDDKLIDDSGASAKAARRSLRHSKSELMAFKRKNKEKQDRKRRAWLSAD